MFVKVRTEGDVWRYIKHSLLTSFHDNGTTYISDETNHLVGSAIIRLIRGDSGKCMFSSKIGIRACSICPKKDKDK